MSITVKGNPENWGQNISYGNVTINPCLDSGIYKWYLQIIQMNRSIILGIGGNHKVINKRLGYSGGAPNYTIDISNGSINANCVQALHGKKSQYNNYGIPQNFHLQSGDILCMEFNVDKVCLKFHVNDKDFGIAFKESDIAVGVNQYTKKNIEYKLAVSLGDPGDSVKLIKFEHIFQ